MLSPLSHDDPHRIGAHRLIARLGSGGMGTVYLARSDAGRTAALKTMHAHIATDPGFRTRFRLEVDAARVIGPVHGARVFDADPLAETPWLATEYVLGPPLDDAVALAGPLPEPAVRALGALLCAALGRLHASEVVHRDLKPSNIMVTADGPKVIDFGIARAIGDDRLTRAGTTAGTPAFMSPEQATGQEHAPAGDVFALAGVLVFAATGHGPFGTGQHADLVYRVRYAEPDLTGVPPALLPVLARCLAKDPADRPTTAGLAALLDPGPDAFATRLPEPLLGEIVRRVGAVRHALPRRLPAPPDHALAETRPGDAPAGPSRRKLLLLGGGSVLGAAAIGGGVWAQSRPGDTSAQQPPAPKQPKWDLLWQVPTASVVLSFPPAPLVLDGLVVVGENGVKGLDPVTGKPKWSDPDVYFRRKVATDGRKLYAADGLLTDTAPLGVFTVDPATGENGTPFGTFEDMPGNLYGTQLLCATGDAVYLTGGRSPRRTTEAAFREGQRWFLLAVDVLSGRKLWEVPLPARQDGSDRLHFLSARVSGGHLVLVQQAGDGGLRLAVHDARTGEALWDRPLDGDRDRPVFDRAHLAVDDRHVYPSAGGLVALRLADGKQAWRFDGNAPGARFGPPAVGEDTVYAVEEGRGAVALDAATGRVRWAEKGRAVTGADLDVPPVVGPVHLYSRSSTGLVASDLRTGAVSRPFKAARARYFAHVPAGRLIAVGDEYTAAYPLV
ncbi:protein kinase domain-containing protein [Streptomyces cinereoruber]|uniref:protein kinase domain-containing protein n=1 Tax=Streptomyces cinereoruber TaxID=67260 RepID=UPI0036352F08